MEHNTYVILTYKHNIEAMDWAYVFFQVKNFTFSTENITLIHMEGHKEKTFSDPKCYLGKTKIQAKGNAFLGSPLESKIGI